MESDKPPDPFSAIAAAATIVGTVSGLSSAREAQKAQAATEEVTLEQVKIAKELHDFWKESYKSTEILLTSEVIAEANQGEKIIDLHERGTMIDTQLSNQFFIAYQNMDRLFRKVCNGVIDKFIIRQFTEDNKLALVDLINFSYRYAEFRTQALNDRSWSRMSQVSGLGRGMMRDSLNYQKAAAETLTSIGFNAASNAKNAIKGVGYMMSRDRKNGNVPTYQYRSTPGINPNV